MTEDITRVMDEAEELSVGIVDVGSIDRTVVDADSIVVRTAAVSIDRGLIDDP